MPHLCIVGRTETGKTTLAKRLGHALLRQHVEVIAYNPIGNHDFTRPDDKGRVSASAEYSTPEAFLAAVKRRIDARDGKPTFLIIDEATTFFKKSHCPRAWLATLGRHHGLNLIIICQHFAQLNTVVRGQCPTLYLFACGLTTAAVCADEFGHKELATANAQKRGHYMVVTPDGLTRGKVFG